MYPLFKQSYLPYVLFMVGVVLIFLWARSRSSVEGFADEGEYEFAMYYADWCPHCHSAKPEFEKLGAIQTIGGKRVKCAAYEEKKNAAALAGKEIGGFPTFQLYGPQGNLVKTYDGGRTQGEFQSFLESVLNRAK